MTVRKALGICPLANQQSTGEWLRSMAGFATRLALNEGGYFAGENKASLVNRVRALVEAGELPKSVLQAIDAPSTGGIPTEVRRRPAFEEAFQHVHNKWKPGARIGRRHPSVCSSPSMHLTPHYRLSQTVSVAGRSADAACNGAV